MSILQRTVFKHINLLALRVGLRRFTTMANMTFRGHLLCTIPFPEPKPVIERIRQTYPNLKVTFAQPSESIADEAWNDVTVLCTLFRFPPDLKLAPHLECVHLVSAGSDHLRNEPIYTSSQIPITTSSGIHGPIIGEWVIMTSLVASHRYSILHEWQKAQSWEDSPSAKAHFASVTDNVGKRLGILGYGSIGRQVARYAQVMGMDVVAFTANPRNGPESRRDHGYVVPGTGDPEGEIPSAWFSGLDKKSLHEFLSYDLDQLLVCVPLTQQTKHLLGKEEFDILSKKNAFVTNIARGEILVQEALIDALKDFENSSFSPGEGKKGLRGAALDVATPEPLPKDHPLWTAPNCIITPHMSGINHNYSTRALQVVEKNLERLAKGERLLNLVNRETGYASKLA